MYTQCLLLQNQQVSLSGFLLKFASSISRDCQLICAGQLVVLKDSSCLNDQTFPLTSRGVEGEVIKCKKHGTSKVIEPVN